jgi:hypothetical protein
MPRPQAPPEPGAVSMPHPPAPSRLDETTSDE